MFYSPGDLVVCYRQTGTQVAKLQRRVNGRWHGKILSASSGQWSRTARPIEEDDILGPAEDFANRSQRAALRRI